jgi:prepilin-type N-terminal cleavage/methylation domain-containing protein
MNKVLQRLMTNLPLKQNRNQAFSLIELTIVIAIMSTVAAGALTLASMKRDQNKAEITVERLEAIDEALDVYARKMLRLPCPASGTAVESSADFGRATDCNAAAPTGTVDITPSPAPANYDAANEQLRYGVVPTRTLGLPDEYMYDGWNNRFSYAVIKELAHENGSQINSYETDMTTGVIELTDGTNPLYDTSSGIFTPEEYVVAYVLISHGEDRKGAYNRAGTIGTECETGGSASTALDAENCHFITTTALYDDMTFVDAPVAPNDNPDSATHFDDYVKRKQLFFMSEQGQYDEMDLSNFFAGHYHMFAVQPNGLAYAWGKNHSGAGALGVGHTSDVPVTDPEPVQGNLRWQEIRSDKDETCGLTVDGEVYCWGRGNRGQLGNGGTSDSPVPVQISGVTPACSRYVKVDVDAALGCALCEDGRLFCFGMNWKGLMGTGSPSPSEYLNPFQVGGGRLFRNFFTAYVSMCGIEFSGDMYCWGDSEHGVIGDGGTTASTPVTPQLVIGGHSWLTGESNHDTICGITTDAELYCWGKNNDDGWGSVSGDVDGLLGTGATFDETSTPQLVPGGPGWTDLSFGIVHACGIRNGEVLCWGDNNRSQIGNPAAGANQTTPLAIDSPYSDFVSISANGWHTCAKRASGAVYCWGRNHHGQLGDGTTTTQVSPVLSTALYRP